MSGGECNVVRVHLVQSIVIALDLQAVVEIGAGVVAFYDGGATGENNVIAVEMNEDIADR